MKERIANVPTADGQMETFITHPEQDGPFAAVVLYMDVCGASARSCTTLRGVSRPSDTAWPYRTFTTARAG